MTLQVMEKSGVDRYLTVKRCAKKKLPIMRVIVHLKSIEASDLVPFADTHSFRQ